MRWIRALPPCLVFIVASAACGSVSRDDTAADASQSGNEDGDHVGIWEFASGDMWAGQLGQQLRFLELLEDGTGQLYSHYESGVLGCGQTLIHARLDNQVLSIDLQPFGLRAYRFEMIDEDSLAITDPDGMTVAWTRADQVPNDVRCSSLSGTDVVALEDGFRPHGFSGLATPESNSFWISGNDYGVYPVNPTTGALGTALTTSGQYVHVQTAMGGDYLAHCGCGGSQDVNRYTPNNTTAVETISSTDLGEEIGVRAVAWDGSFIWMTGYGRQGNGNPILKVGGTTGARTLVESFDFQPPLRSLTARDSELWGLINDYGRGGALVHIDPTTQKAVATYELPTDGVWQALGSVDDSFYILGMNDYQEGLILKADAE